MMETFNTMLMFFTGPLLIGGGVTIGIWGALQIVSLKITVQVNHCYPEDHSDGND